MFWQGWGAGPAGATSTGGPSRGFQRVLAGACGVTTVAMLADRQWLAAAVAAAGTVYFALRATGKLGPRREDPPGGPGTREQP